MKPARADERPDHYKQLTGAAGVLAAVAGYVNALTVAGAMHTPTTHMSGVTTRLSVDLVNDAARPTLFLDVGLLVAFVVGAAVSGAIIDSTVFRPGRRYGVLLLIESLILFGAWLATPAALPVLQLAPLALAAGLQNAMATQFSRAVVRTTHVTGILTDLGIALGKWVARRGVDAWRVVLYATIFLGFACGGVSGAVAFKALGHDALLVPIAVTGLGGVSYYVARHRWLARRRGASAA